MARGSVRKHDGGWGYRIDLGPDPATGKRRQASRQGFATKREAETALRDVTSSMPDGVVPTRSVRTLGDFLDEWLELQRDRLRPTTWHSYGHAVRASSRASVRSKLQALAPLQLEHFYAELLASGGRTGKPLSPKTMRNTHRAPQGTGRRRTPRSRRLQPGGCGQAASRCSRPGSSRLDDC